MNALHSLENRVRVLFAQRISRVCHLVSETLTRIGTPPKAFHNTHTSETKSPEDKKRMTCSTGTLLCPQTLSSVPRRCRCPFGALGRPPRPSAEGAYGASKGWTRRQPSQVSPGALWGEVPGFPGRAGHHQAAGKEGGGRPRRPPTQHEDLGTSVPRVGGLLPLLHPQLFLPSRPLDRPDQKGAAWVLRPSCPKYRKVRNTPSCSSAGSWRRLRGTTLPSRKRLWP